MTTAKTVQGLRYTQADHRDRQADIAQALSTTSTDHDALMALHGMGYNCSDAKVVRTNG